jgi:hypothetical protein
MRNGGFGGIKLNNFLNDLEYSLEQRDNDLFDNWYYRTFPGLNKIEFVHELKTQRKGIDKVLYFDNGKAITIDEKKRRRNYNDILLELWSVWESRKLGWLFTSQCDYIVYAIMPSKKVYLLPTLLLRRAWYSNKERWKTRYRMIDAINRSYTTKSIAVPADVLAEAVSREMNQSFYN